MEIASEPSLPHSALESTDEEDDDKEEEVDEVDEVDGEVAGSGASLVINLGQSLVINISTPLKSGCFVALNKCSTSEWV